MTARLVALAILDCAVLAWCGVADLPAVWGLAAHAGLATLGYGAWLSAGGAIGLAPAIAGVLGPLAILLVAPLSQRSRLRGAADSASADRDGSAPSRRATAQAAARMLDGRAHFATPDALGSLVTIMRHGDVATRRQALETAVRSFEPALSPLIALALTDADQTIRALAAAASARVAQNLALARADLERREGTGDPTAAKALATLLADHARADVLLSDSQRRNLREDAVHAMGQSDRSDDPERTALAIEAAWADGDYVAIDRLAGSTPAQDDRVAAWWRVEAAA